jgi:hypothetical protein
MGKIYKTLLDYRSDDKRLRAGAKYRRNGTDQPGTNHLTIRKASNFKPR